MQTPQGVSRFFPSPFKLEQYSPPRKRQRIDPPASEDDVLEQRYQSTTRLKSAWDSIFLKYSTGNHIASEMDDVVDLEDYSIIDDQGLWQSIEPIKLGQFGLPGSNKDEHDSSDDEDSNAEDDFDRIDSLPSAQSEVSDQYKEARRRYELEMDDLRAFLLDEATQSRRTLPPEDTFRHQTPVQTPTRSMSTASHRTPSNNHALTALRSIPPSSGNSTLSKALDVQDQDSDDDLGIASSATPKTIKRSASVIKPSSRWKEETPLPRIKAISRLKADPTSSSPSHDHTPLPLSPSGRRGAFTSSPSTRSNLSSSSPLASSPSMTAPRIRRELPASKSPIPNFTIPIKIAPKPRRFHPISPPPSISPPPCAEPSPTPELVVEAPVIREIRPLPTPPNSQTSRKRPRSPSFDTIPEERSLTPPISRIRSPPISRRPEVAPPQPEEQEDSDDDIVVLPGKPKSPRRIPSLSPSPPPPLLTASKLPPAPQDDDDTSDDEIIILSSPPRKKASSPVKAPSKPPSPIKKPPSPVRMTSRAPQVRTPNRAVSVLHMHGSLPVCSRLKATPQKSTPIRRGCSTAPRASGLRKAVHKSGYESDDPLGI